MTEHEIITFLLDRRTQLARVNEGTAAERIIAVNPEVPPFELVDVLGHWEAREIVFESAPRKDAR